MARVGSPVREPDGREEAREVVAKGTRPGQRRKVHRALRSRRAGRRAAKRRQHGGHEEDDERRADRQRKRLALLCGGPRGRREQPPGEARHPSCGPATDLEPSERTPRGHQPKRARGDSDRKPAFAKLDHGEGGQRPILCQIGAKQPGAQRQGRIVQGG